MLNNWSSLPSDERLNVITHGLGLILVIIGTPFLLIETYHLSDWSVFWCMAAFTFGMMWMYSSSTIYHFALDVDKKKVLRKVDHIAIFGLIGGSYTPFISIYYNKTAGWIFLAILWLIILMGMLVKIFRIGKSRFLSTLLYVLLGWMVVVIYKPITEGMSTSVFAWLVAGGAFYSIGVVFYMWKNLKYHHAVWHLFVVGGTMSHFFSLYYSL